MKWYQFHLDNVNENRRLSRTLDGIAADLVISHLQKLNMRYP
ncbi:hypothetical protein [uncultured Nostoc sp.]